MAQNGIIVQFIIHTLERILFYLKQVKHEQWMEGGKGLSGHWSKLLQCLGVAGLPTDPWTLWLCLSFLKPMMGTVAAPAPATVSSLST